MQVQKFARLFEYAKQRSRFYREFYGAHGVLDLKIESFADIQRVPLTSKAILKKYSLPDIMTRDLDDAARIHSTSGSTGEPFKIAFDKFADYSGHVRLITALMEKGYRPHKKMVLLSRYEPGHEFEIEADIKKIGFFQNKIGWFKRELVSIFDPVEVMIQKLEKIKPFVLWSTPSIVENIALELKRSDKKLDIPLVLLMAENISPAGIRRVTERIGKNFIDLYGCMESPSIAFGVNQTQVKRVFSNSTLVEVANRRPMGDKIVGDVIITNLINHTMPFIRYETGDYAHVLDDDRFPNQRLSEILGRCDDVMHFGGHYTLAFHQTYQLFGGFHECAQYKFIQKPDDEIVLQLAVDETADKEKVKAMALQKWNEKFPDYPLTIVWTDTFASYPKKARFKVLEKVSE